jgi:DNA polymerase V
MVRAGILSGAILVVDRSLHAQHGDIVLAAVSGEFTCKRLYVRDSRFRLVPESEDARYRPIEPGDGEDVSIWGVVTAAVNEFRRGRGH